MLFYKSYIREENKIKIKLLPLVTCTLLIVSMFSMIGLAEKKEEINITMLDNEKKDTLFYRIYTDKCSVNSNGEDEIKSGEMVGGGDVLDQQQIETNNRGWYILPIQWVAQGFKPTLSILTRVELYLFKIGNPPDDIKFTVSITDDLYGSDLVIVSKNKSELPDISDWVEFDFADIIVIPGQTYYIVCRADRGYVEDGYLWFMDFYNPYIRGHAWGSPNQGNLWWIMDYPPEYPETDCCFKTYGLDESRVKTTFIIGRISNLNGIKNFNTFEAVNIGFIQLFPYQLHRYHSGEKVAVLDQHLGILNQNLICGIFKAHI